MVVEYMKFLNSRGDMLKEYLAEINEEFLFADGFDDAIIGYGERCGLSVVLYDARICIEILMDRDGMTDEEAEEFFNYNVLGSYVGEMTPIFCFLNDDLF